MPHEFKITRRVEFSDTDMEGIMHFSNFFRFMETAEHAFLRSLGLSAVLSRNGLQVGLPRVHAQCDFSAPLRFEDEVLIHLLVERKGRRSLTYQFRFYRSGDSGDREVARGRVVAVCATRRQDGSFKAAPLPKLLADQIQQAPNALLAGLQKPSVPRKQKGNTAPPKRTPSASIHHRNSIRRSHSAPHSRRSFHRGNHYRHQKN